MSSTGALSLAEVPKQLVVIGAGYIGLELGSVWRRLGAEVTVVEIPRPHRARLDGEWPSSSSASSRSRASPSSSATKVTGVETDGDGVQASRSSRQPAARSETLEADVVLVAVGRVPYTEGLGLDEVGVKTRQSRPRQSSTSTSRLMSPGIYAIGDVIAGPMLAHKAEDEGVAVAEILAGQAGHVNYDAIPSVDLHRPEVASVGKTEEELKEAGRRLQDRQVPFTANGRAKVNRRPKAS